MSVCERVHTLGGAHASALTVLPVDTTILNGGVVADVTTRVPTSYLEIENVFGKLTRVDTIVLF